MFDHLNINKLVIIAAAGILFILVRISVFEVKEYTPDELQYLGHVKFIEEKGFLEGSRALMREYHSEEWRWANPPPSRLGHIFLARISAGIFNDTTEKAGARVSFLESIIAGLSCLVAIYLLTGEWRIAALGLFLLSVSGWEIAMSRRSWTDNGMTALCGILFCLAIAGRNSAKIWKLLSFAIFSGATLWFKESGPAASALLVIIVGFPFNNSFRWAQSIKFGLAWLVGMVVSYVILSFFLGGWDQLWIVARHISAAVPNAYYARVYQDGSFLMFFKSAYVLIPGFTFCFMISIAGLIVKFRNAGALRNLNESENVAAATFAAFVMLVIAASIPLYYKNLRYLSPFLIPLYASVTYILYDWLGGRQLFTVHDTSENRLKHIPLLTVAGLFFAFVLIQDLMALQICLHRNGLADLNFRMLMQSM